MAARRKTRGAARSGLVKNMRPSAGRAKRAVCVTCGARACSICAELAEAVGGSFLSEKIAPQVGREAPKI